MTITRHDITATTADLVADPSPSIGTSYFRRAPFPTWANATDAVGGWFGAQPDVSVHPATDPAGRDVLELRASPAAVGTSATAMHAGVMLKPSTFYRIAARVRNPTPAVALRADVDVTSRGFIYLQSGLPVIGSDYTEVWAVLETNTSTASRWVTVRMVRPAAGTLDTLQLSGVQVTELTQEQVMDLRPERATITLDESWSPYARATLTCPMPQTDVLDRIDPRRATWVRLRLRQATAASLPASALEDLFPATTLGDLSAAFAAAGVETLRDLSALVGDPYNATDETDRDHVREALLLLRERRVDYVTGTMTLELTSAEAALLDLARYETDHPILMPPATSSLEYLVAWALRLFGWALSGVVDDAVIDHTTVEWNTGETLWDFLDAHVRGAGRRLWCDELGRWRLTVPMTGTGGTVVVDRPTAVTDTLSRDADDWSDVAVVVYEWTDNAGAQQSLSRWAGEQVGSGRVQLPKTLVQRWKVPGTFDQASTAASALWRRSRDRGRPLQVSAVSDYRVSPGAALSMPTGLVAPLADAMVSAVTWSWPEDEMTIRTRDASTED